jgi:Fe-S oxidoreductase/nitrate reductase gamma subunit
MPTEQTILGVAGYVWLRTIAAVCVAVFVWRMWQLGRVLRRGAPENRWDHIGLRVRLFLKEVMGQTRMFREPVIGWAHPAIFWGFCLFVIASTLMLLGGMFPAWSIVQVEQIPVLGTLVDLFAVVVLIGLIAAAVRRYFFTPPGLQRTFDASLILVLIAALMVTFLWAEAGEAESGEQTWLPVGQGLHSLLLGLGASSSTVALQGDLAWRLHVVILLGFLAYLPYSKHMHLLWAPLAVFCAEVPGAGQLPPAVEAGEAAATTPLGQFTWRMLLNAYSCAECGRCERVCPAFASGSSLSPRAVIHDFKQFVLREGLTNHAGSNGSNGKKGTNGKGICEQIDGEMAAEAYWACTTCYACMDLCPVRNEHVPVIVQVRRKLMDQGAVDTAAQDAMMSLQRYGNSQGKSPRKRFQWAKELSFPLRDAQQEPVEWLWFVGDYAAFHPSSVKASRLVAQLFQAAGLDFGVLLNGERCAGNDARRLGEEGLFELLREQNSEALAKADFQRIVTTDPHTYHTLKHEYPQLAATPIVHYSELLDECLAKGLLTVTSPRTIRATYHDPCYLGRINGIYESPRRVLDALGVQRVELPRNRRDSLCCGAGGGKLWMEDEPGVQERPAVNRIREALLLDGVTHFVVACPKDLGMFEDAVKTAGADGRLRVVDLGELVFDAVETLDMAEAQS